MVYQQFIILLRSNYVTVLLKHEEHTLTSVKLPIYLSLYQNKL